MRRALTAALCLLSCMVACGTPPADRTPAPDAPFHDVSSRVPTGTAPAPWPENIGSFLAVDNVTKGEALLFRRDTSSMPASISVVGFDSASTRVSLRDVRAVPCATRALLRVNGAPAGWSVALDSARARPVLIDALEDLSRADSQRVVVRIQRVLNALPDSGDAMEFRGLPVVVRDAWVVRLPSGPITVARGARLRNLEATAHEELRFIILENDQPRYIARVAGDEEVVESWDLLAAVVTDRGPVLAVAREGTRSLQLELVALERGSWRSIWRSDALTCASGK